MYKAIFERNIYEQIPKILISYVGMNWYRTYEKFDGVMYNKFLHSGKLPDHIEIDNLIIMPMNDMDNPKKYEKIVNNFTHILEIGDTIKIDGERLKIKNSIFNIDNSIIYQLEDGIIMSENYNSLKLEEEEKLKTIKNLLNKQQKEELVNKKKKRFFGLW